MAKQLYYSDSTPKRYIVKDREGNIKAYGVSHTDDEIRQIKAAGYKVKEVSK